MRCEDTLISVKNLSIFFGENRVVNSISFNLKKREVLGIVGESGSGKSMICLAIMGLLPQKNNVKGSILFEGKNILSQDERNLRALRGSKISMVFQQAMSSLNPSMRCGEQVLEMLLHHKKIAHTQGKKEVLKLFKKVKLPKPYKLYHKYPHQISGGQQQRVMIAMAICCNPQILIADEPTTALDISVQKEIIKLLKNIQKTSHLSIIFISHDLNTISEIADKVMVLYKGNLVEKGPLQKVFNSPEQNYTKALIECRPKIGNRLEKLPTIADFQNTKKIFRSSKNALHFIKKYIKPNLF